jgi:MSHA pilin protein MshC
MSTDNVSLVTKDAGGSTFSFIEFDDLGRPNPSRGPDCSPCTIEITGESTVKVGVESQGYVHACE